MLDRKRRYVSDDFDSGKSASRLKYQALGPQDGVQPFAKRQRLPVDGHHIQTPTQAAHSIFPLGCSPGQAQSTQQPHHQAECGEYNSSHGNFAHALPQRQWSGSSGNNSTNCSFSQYPSAMDEDQQSVTPNTSSSQDHFSDHPMGMLSSSNSAPDLRLLLTTSLPDTHDMFLPTSGSYAGALVPYKGPQQVIAEAKQHHTKQLVAQLTRHIHEADRAVQGAAANALSQLDTSGSVPVEAKDELMVSPTHNTSGSVLASMFPADGHALSEMLQANSLEMEVDTEGC